MLCISEWVMNAHKYEEDIKCKIYKDIEQKILSYSQQFGCDDLIEYDKSLSSYYPTLEHEEGGASQEFIDEFVEETFWDELLNRLAKRDLIKDKGHETVNAMDPVERMMKIEEYEGKYKKEFEENGISNLKF